MKERETTSRKKPKVILVKPGGKPRPTADSLERLRQMAEEKGWIKKQK